MKDELYLQQFYGLLFSSLSLLTLLRQHKQITSAALNRFGKDIVL